jgi:hypothetical protein
VEPAQKIMKDGLYEKKRTQCSPRASIAFVFFHEVPIHGFLIRDRTPPQRKALVRALFKQGFCLPNR